jgi:hypothetical protein
MLGERFGEDVGCFGSLKSVLFEVLIGGVARFKVLMELLGETVGVVNTGFKSMTDGL